MHREPQKAQYHILYRNCNQADCKEIGNLNDRFPSTISSIPRRMTERKLDYLKVGIEMLGYNKSTKRIRCR